MCGLCAGKGEKGWLIGKFPGGGNGGGEAAEPGLAPPFIQGNAGPAVGAGN